MNHPEDGDRRALMDADWRWQMFLHSGLRILALMATPALFSVNVDQGLGERPHLTGIVPQAAAPAAVVTAFGFNLDRSNVAELILEGSDGTIMTHIVEQQPDLIRFRVPRSLEPGLYRIVLLAETSWGTELIDQDIVLTVLKADDVPLSIAVSGVSKQVELLHLVAQRVAGDI
jgi:hypothetical protein